MSNWGLGESQFFFFGGGARTQGPLAPATIDSSQTVKLLQIRIRT